MPRMRTTFSCCGHGVRPFWVHLRVCLDRPGLASLAKLANSTSHDAISGRAPCRLLVEDADANLPSGHLHLRLFGPTHPRKRVRNTALTDLISALEHP